MIEHHIVITQSVNDELVSVYSYDTFALDTQCDDGSLRGAGDVEDALGFLYTEVAILRDTLRLHRAPLS